MTIEKNHNKDHQNSHNAANRFNDADPPLFIFFLILKLLHYWMNHILSKFQFCFAMAPLAHRQGLGFILQGHTLVGAMTVTAICRSLISKIYSSSAVEVIQVGALLREMA